jgi:hypothetical protein
MPAIVYPQCRKLTGGAALSLPAQHDRKKKQKQSRLAWGQASFLKK